MRGHLPTTVHALRRATVALSASVSPASVMVRADGALNAVLTDAVLAGVIGSNPVRELKRRRQPKGDVKGAPALAVDQVRELLKAIEQSAVCRSKDLRDPVLTLAATGLRRGELLALRWKMST
jgi:integrase